MQSINKIEFPIEYVKQKNSYLVRPRKVTARAQPVNVGENATSRPVVTTIRTALNEILDGLVGQVEERG